MDEHRKYLADRLLSEERPITYRLLSRALDVHVNTAKEMLYDFHKYQNETKANSVHATYLVYGSKTIQSASNGDVEMSSSMPDQDVGSETVPTKSLTLVAEENLQDLLAQFTQVAAIHVYSLAPHPQRELTLLSDVSKSLAEYRNEDVVAASKKYGTILNSHLRRRARKGTASVAPPKSTAAPAKPVKAEPVPSAASKPTPPAPVKEEKPEPSKSSTPSSTTTGKAATPSLKRGSSGGIMQAFGKAKPPKPKAAVKKEEDEDTSMALSDDGEANDEDLPPSKKSTADAETARAARKKREDDLRRMMEEEEDDDDEKDEEMKEPEEEEEPKPEPEPEPEAEPEAAPKEEEKPQEMVSSSGDGRRRGKRKVLKKKRTLDAQGFMVTTTEEGWESFSEDDTPAPTKKESASSTPTSSAAKAKKPPAASKGSQGSIMSFFGKK